MEYLKKGEEWQLTLYCESDEGWHTCRHSVYDFALHADWVKRLRPHWNAAASHMRRLGKIMTAGGALSGEPTLGVIGLVTEKLGDLPSDVRELREGLGHGYEQVFVGIELRSTLEALIKALDAERQPAQHNGGLNKHITEDGRVLWLCPDHHPKPSRPD